MSKMSKSESNFNTIYQVSLSSETARFKKCLTLSQIGKTKEDAFVMVDIRRYVNGTPTKSGVCLTPFEFDWLSNLLLLANIEKKQNYELANKSSLRKIIINFKPNKSLEIVQRVDDRYKRITLTLSEKKEAREKLW